MTVLNSANGRLHDLAAATAAASGGGAQTLT